jgi:hypothetical protein
VKPLDNITVIRRSLAVFVCGIASLLPVIGLLPAIYAFVRGWEVYHRYQGFNPAANYAKWGARLALLGLFLSFLFVLVVEVSSVPHGKSHSNWSLQE